MWVKHKVNLSIPFACDIIVEEKAAFKALSQLIASNKQCNEWKCEKKTKLLIAIESTDSVQTSASEKTKNDPGYESDPGFRIRIIPKI